MSATKAGRCASSQAAARSVRQVAPFQFRLKRAFRGVSIHRRTSGTPFFLGRLQILSSDRCNVLELRIPLDPKGHFRLIKQSTVVSKVTLGTVLP